MVETRNYAYGTSVTVRMPWGLFVKGRAVCPDGKVRAIRLSDCADTFFSIPASVKYRGKTVAGYATFNEDAAGRWVEFRVVAGRKNSGAFAPAVTVGQ